MLPIRIAWWLWFVAILLLIAGAVALSSCVHQALPACAAWQAEAVVDDEGYVTAIVVDADNIRRLHRLVTGLAAGTCRLAPPGVAA